MTDLTELDARGIPFVPCYAPQTIDGGRVRVYRNLNRRATDHSSPIYSVQSMGARKRVVSHAGRVTLTDVKFIVSMKGNARVRQEKRKMVHAYVEGKPTSQHVHEDGLRAAYYNPYKTTSFVDAETGEPIYSADLVVIDASGVRYSRTA